MGRFFFKCLSTRPPCIIGVLLKSIFNRKTNSSESNINIKLGEQMITSETDLAELFNDYFVNVASNQK